jgi:hypothetical protein
MLCLCYLILRHPFQWVLLLPHFTDSNTEARDVTELATQL